MKTLILSGLLVLASCGKQAEENYYSQIETVENELESRTESPESDGTYVYGKKTEPLTSMYEFNFPLKVLASPKSFPKSEDIQFYKVFEQRNVEVNELNHQSYDKGTREITIQGKHIVIDLSDSQKILRLIHNAQDLSKLTIEADILEIKTGVNLPQTNLTINAREITFSNEGYFDTTPMSLNYPAEQFKDGTQGLDGGAIIINAFSIIYDMNRETPILKSHGGNGQEAGAGKDGARGHNAQIYQQPNYRQVRNLGCPSRDMEGMGAHMHKLNLLLDAKKGRPSGNGADAIVGGAPGAPGKAGDIIANKASHIKIPISAKSGIAGKRAENNIGGEPGKPAKTCKIKKQCGDIVKTYKCITAIKGSDVEAKTAKVISHPSKRLMIQEKSWTTEAIIEYNVKFLEEMYFRGHLNSALLEKYKIEAYLDQKSDLSPQLLLVKAKLQNLDYQLASRLDFYGNPTGWTPSFNFSLNFKAFKNEVQRSLKILFYTDSLQKKLIANDSIVAATTAFQSELMQDVADSEKKLNDLVPTISDLTESIDELAVARDEFDTELKQVEREIKRLARNNLKEPFMSKAVKILAAASKVIPVGQPALALVGEGLQIVHTISQSNNTTQDILNNVPNFLSKVGKVDFAKAGEDLSGKLKEISLNKLSQFSKVPENETSKERMERLKKDFASKKKLIGEMVDFYGPIIDSVKEQTEMMRTREVSKSALEQEIAKIKRKHKMFKKITKLLENLHIKQSKTNLLLKKTQTEIGVNLQKITENILLVSDLYTELGTASKVQTQKLHSLLDRFRDRAINNLKFYHYKLTKAYEYKTLKKYDGEIKLAQVYDAISSLIETNEGSATNEDLNHAMLAFEDELSKITRDSIERYEAGDTSLTLKKKFFLSEKEILELNSGNTIYLDLSNINHFGKNKENIRLQNIVMTPVASGSHGDLEIMIEHDKKSVIQKEEINYIFSHTYKNSNQHKWITSLNLPTDTLAHSEAALEDLEMLEAILGTNLKIKKMYANPSARGFYKISLNKEDSQTKLKQLEIEFDISFQPKY